MTAVRNLHDVSLEFLNYSIQEPIEVSYFDDGIRADFPSPANDFQELKSLLTKKFSEHHQAKFSVQDSMKSLGIDSCDTVVLYKALHNTIYEK